MELRTHTNETLLYYIHPSHWFPSLVSFLSEDARHIRGNNCSGRDEITQLDVASEGIAAKKLNSQIHSIVALAQP